jgi:hypothetical protein
MTSRMLHRWLRYSAALLLAVPIVVLVLTTEAHAQASGERLRREYQDLSTLLDAAWLADARVFETLTDIGSMPGLSDARRQFAASLRMRARMSMAEMMAMMRMQSDMQMLGPFEAQESAARAELLDLFQSPVSRREVRNAYGDSSLPSGAVDVLRRGGEFESRVFEILATDSIGDKSAALAAAADAYLAEGSTVPGSPKPAALLLDHPYHGAFVEGFPRLSSIVWSAQWLRLAALEAIVFEEQGSGYWGSVAEVEARFRSKLSQTQRGGSPVPVELPMAPAIAPTLYSLSPRTAIILDNLSMFRAIVADLLAWPNPDDTATRIKALVTEFTDHAGSQDTTIDYLVSALRGGIYNQGGPAIGELQESERNRSRMEMGMQHSMIMSSP